MNNAFRSKIASTIPLLRFLVLLLVMLGIIACAPDVQPTAELPTAAPEQTPIPQPTLAKWRSVNGLYNASKIEGMLTTIALPHDWCNYGALIDGFKKNFPGIVVNELPDVTPREVLETLRTDPGDSAAQVPDVIDVSVAFGELAKQEGLLQPYRILAWADIPTSAKDPDGYWYGGYYGVMSFMVNADVVKNIPEDWQDLLEPEYKSQIGMSADPRTSNQAARTVQAASLANGGTVTEPVHGLQYFAYMNQLGNLVPLIANNTSLIQGQTPIRLTWDFDALAGRDSLNGTPQVEVVVPKSGKLADLYVQAIYKNARHPNAARLWMEYIYSDEGQLTWLSPPGYCHPIRQDAMDRAGKIPADLKARLPDTKGVTFPSAADLAAGKAIITTNWNRAVGVDIVPRP
jgi:putative spermidine/putrescine transport system substrate-binding protein